MSSTPPEIHPDFKLNGIHYELNALKEVAYSLIKEGEPFEISIGDFLLDWLSEDHQVYITTSGATGPPKRLRFEKEQLVNSALATASYFKLRERSKTLHCLPSDFIAGKMMWVRAMVNGWHMDYVMPSSDPLWQVNDEYDFCAMVPMQLKSSLTKLKYIKTLIVGGAPISSSLQESLKGVQSEVYETYGMTETLTHIALKPLNKDGGSEYFQTIPGVKVKQDKRGCLIIDAPKISPGQVITNDLVELKSETSFKWLGRIDSLINSGGIKIIPEQLEAKLAELINQRFFIAGVADETLGQHLVLVIEGKEDPEVYKAITSSKLLEKHEIPKEYLFLGAFRQTSSGKIKREETLQLAKN